MIVELGNAKQMLSHVLLQDKEVCSKIATDWEDSHVERTPIVLTATLTVNGHDLPPEALESAMQELFRQVDSHYKSQYADVEALVKSRVEELIRAKASDLVDKMRILDYALDSLLEG